MANLLANAIDAVEQQTEPGIAIAIREGTDAVQLIVRDNGCGIPAPLLDHIFEPFFTTKKNVGTGLGLYLSQELAKKNAGSLWLQSSTEPDKHGTIAYLTLPIASAMQKPIPAIERVRARGHAESQ